MSDGFLDDQLDFLAGNDDDDEEEDELELGKLVAEKSATGTRKSSRKRTSPYQSGAVDGNSARKRRKMAKEVDEDDPLAAMMAEKKAETRLMEKIEKEEAAKMDKLGKDEFEDVDDEEVNKMFTKIGEEEKGDQLPPRGALISVLKQSSWKDEDNDEKFRDIPDEWKNVLVLLNDHSTTVLGSRVPVKIACEKHLKCPKPVCLKLVSKMITESQPSIANEAFNNLVGLLFGSLSIVPEAKLPSPKPLVLPVEDATKTVLLEWKPSITEFDRFIESFGYSLDLKRELEAVRTEGSSPERQQVQRGFVANNLCLLLRFAQLCLQRNHCELADDAKVLQSFMCRLWCVTIDLEMLKVRGREYSINLLGALFEAKGSNPFDDTFFQHAIEMFQTQCIDAIIVPKTAEQKENSRFSITNNDSEDEKQEQIVEVKLRKLAILLQLAENLPETSKCGKVLREQIAFRVMQDELIVGPCKDEVVTMETPSKGQNPVNPAIDNAFQTVVQTMERLHLDVNLTYKLANQAANGRAIRASDYHRWHLGIRATELGMRRLLEPDNKANRRVQMEPIFKRLQNIHRDMGKKFHLAYTHLSDYIQMLTNILLPFASNEIMRAGAYGEQANQRQTTVNSFFSNTNTPTTATPTN